MPYTSETPKIKESRVATRKLVVARGSDALSLQEVAGILNHPERIAALNTAAHRHATRTGAEASEYVNYKIILPLKALDNSEGDAYAVILTGPDIPSTRSGQQPGGHDLFILHKQGVNLHRDFGYSRDENFLGFHVHDQSGDTSLLESDVDTMYFEDNASHTPECVIRSKIDFKSRPRM